MIISSIVSLFLIVEQLRMYAWGFAGRRNSKYAVMIPGIERIKFGQFTIDDKIDKFLEDIIDIVILDRNLEPLGESLCTA
jgi:hypothetical protein